MEIVEICRKITDLGRDTRRTLIYMITAEKYSGENQNVPLEFGVGIKILETQESSFVNCITPNMEKITQLADLLASNFVTPISLKDVVYDWLCS